MKHICIIICLLLCGCKSTKIATDTHEKTVVNSDVSVYHNVATIDTTRLLYNEDVNQTITIEETTITRKYDKDTGVITEETETTRTIRQDTDKVVTEEERKGVESHSEDSLNHIADVSKKVDTSVEEESEGGQESFGKWLGIVIGVAIVIFIVYLLKKLRVI
jgi:hypothetical protein